VDDNVADAWDLHDLHHNTVFFNSFKCTQNSGNILRKPTHLFIHIERNLDSEISHSAADWCIHAQLTSVNFCIDLSQFLLVKAILNLNIGENLSQISSENSTTLLMPNTSIETVLTGDQDTWRGEEGVKVF
jgi:vacuolar protein sorting-associated protein 13D